MRCVRGLQDEQGGCETDLELLGVLRDLAALLVVVQRIEKDEHHVVVRSYRLLVLVILQIFLDAL